MQSNKNESTKISQEKNENSIVGNEFFVEEKKNRTHHESKQRTRFNESNSVPECRVSTLPT